MGFFYAAKGLSISVGQKIVYTHDDHYLLAMSSESKSGNVDGKAPEPGDGIRGVRTTGVFRAVNFELFAKPVSCPLDHNACIILSSSPPPTEEISDDNRGNVHHILCRIPVFPELYP